ncbi:hypothetical protein DHB64_10160 [Antarcticibacterium sp. W02-3]|nr:hypothetical protein [Antarcticibacterium sp. W02-3]
MILGSFITCKSQVSNRNVQERKETQAILNSYFDGFENRGIHFNNKILQNYEGKHWSHLINPFHLSLIQNFNIKNESDVVHFENLFKEEIEFLQKSSRSFRIEKWTEILDKKNIVDSGTSMLSLSSPAFDRSLNYAIFYLSSNEGGSLIIFKKEGNKWVYFASGMVWIS